MLSAPALVIRWEAFGERDVRFGVPLLLELSIGRSRVGVILAKRQDEDRLSARGRSERANRTRIGSSTNSAAPASAPSPPPLDIRASSSLPIFAGASLTAGPTLTVAGHADGTGTRRSSGRERLENRELALGHARPRPRVR